MSSATFGGNFTRLTEMQENHHVNTVQNVTTISDITNNIDGFKTGTISENYGPHGNDYEPLGDDYGPHDTYGNYLEGNDLYGTYGSDYDFGETFGPSLVYLITLYIAIPVGILGIVGNILILIIMNSPRI